MRTGYNKSVPLALDGKNESACGDASADCDWLVHQDRTVSDGSAGVTEHSSNSHLSEKIEVVQQVMTVLETTISSATSAYESSKTEYEAKMEDLLQQIEHLKEERNRNDIFFRNARETLEGGIQKYMVLENKLRTIEERPQAQPDYVMLPDLNVDTDRFVALFSNEKRMEWDRLKLLTQNLNDSTEVSYRNSICERRFQITCPSQSNCSSPRTVAGQANALNLFRGKKFIPPSPNRSQSAPSLFRYVSVTWFKNEVKASHYIQTNYIDIIQDALSDELKDSMRGGPYCIKEVDSDWQPHSTLADQTIHVQAKTRSSTLSASNVPKKITLIQFDADSFDMPDDTVPTLNVQEISPNPEGVMDETGDDGSIIMQPLVGNSEVEVEDLQDMRQGQTESQTCSTDRRNLVPSATIRTLGKSEILAMCGFVDNEICNTRDRTSKSISGSEFKRRPLQRGELPNISSSTISSSQSAITETEKGSSASNELPCDSKTDGGCGHISEWSDMFLRERGIEKLMESQRLFIEAFKGLGDVFYRGIANSGKTTSLAVGLLNNLQADNFSTQAIIITSNNRSSKLIQKLTSIEDGDRIVVCRRVEEIVPSLSLDPSKKPKKPVCQIVVGTPGQISDVVRKNLFNKEPVKFLILYKAEEFFGMEGGHGIPLAMNKILYTLSATIKVIVLCKQTKNNCKPLEDFCRSKLRNKIVVEEDQDVEEFLQRGTRAESGHKNSASSREYNVPARTKSSRSNDNDVPERSLRGGDDMSNDIPLTEPERPSAWRTFVCLDALQYLGIDSTEEKTNPFSDSGITHFYANVVGDVDDLDLIKVDLISMLDLEEDKAVIFCNTIAKTEWLSTKLRQQKLWPQVLNESMSRKEQQVILENFREGSFCRVLICTDFLVSISLDSADVVLNFDFPNSRKVYVSRAGFAVRHIQDCGSQSTLSEPSKDKKGVVVNLITNEIEALKRLQESLGITILNCEDE